MKLSSLGRTSGKEKELGFQIRTWDAANVSLLHGLYVNIKRTEAPSELKHSIKRTNGVYTLNADSLNISSCH